MEYFIVCFVTLIGASLTLFSGFGLGTLLVPVFGIFFPIELAIALTAIVHFLNNLFKITLLGKHANWKIVVQFGIPSLIAAFVGALLLQFISQQEAIYTYSILNHNFYIFPVKLIIAFVLLFFALVEIIPALSSMSFSSKYLVIGGILSGFFGGLSGNQGALRSAFLMRTNLSKESFIATGVIIACLVDISRLSVYSSKLFAQANSLNYTLIVFATTSAFLGSFIGSKLVKKITIRTLQFIVAIMLAVFSLLLGSGLI